MQHLAANDLALTETLIKRFESRELLGYLRAVEFQPDQDARTEAVYGVYAELCEEHDLVPVLAGPDWRECLRLAQQQHEKERLAEALQQEYRAYCQREQAGAAHPSLQKPDPEA